MQEMQEQNQDATSEDYSWKGEMQEMREQGIACSQEEISKLFFFPKKKTLENKERD